MRATTVSERKGSRSYEKFVFQFSEFLKEYRDAYRASTIRVMSRKFNQWLHDAQPKPVAHSAFLSEMASSRASRASP